MRKDIVILDNEALEGVIDEIVNKESGTVAGNSDWNASKDEPGFIKNKPFGIEEDEINYIVEETTLTMGNSSNYGYYDVYSQSIITKPVLGNEYKIIIDNNEYTATLKEANSRGTWLRFVLTDTEDIEDSSFPYFGNWCITLNPNSNNFRLYLKGEEYAEKEVKFAIIDENNVKIKKLDTKFYNEGGFEYLEDENGIPRIQMRNSYSLAEGQYSTAEGQNTIAKGNYSHAEGYQTNANGESSHTEGYQTNANGNYSHAEGFMTNTNEYYSHAEGYRTNANGYGAHAEGQNTIAKGNYSHAEGNETTANGDNSHAEGYYTNANGRYSHAEGYQTNANGNYSHTEGYQTNANGEYSHAEGYQTNANGYASHAEGEKTNANGYASHTEGYYINANGEYSHAEGYQNNANGNISHAEGEKNNANGYQSHVEGACNAANNSQSHAEGYQTNANGFQSHTEGNFTNALNTGEHASGKYNITLGNSSYIINENNRWDRSSLSDAINNNYYKSKKITLINQTINVSMHFSFYKVKSVTFNYKVESNIPSSNYASLGIVAYGNFQTRVSTQGSSEQDYQEYTFNFEDNYEINNVEYRFTKNRETDCENDCAYIYISNIEYYNGATESSEKTLFSIGNGSNPVSRHNALEIRENGDLYLPDTSAEGQIWEKPMYKLPTFGENSIEEKLININSAQPSSGNASSAFYYTGVFAGPSNNIQLGEKYKVIIGNNTWYLTAIQEGGSIIGITDGTNTKQTGHPVPDDATFIIYFNSGSYSLYTRFDFNGQKVIVSKITETIKKIDPKYLPNQEYNSEGVTWGKLKKSPYNGYDYVDMGEAGIWATYNVGASSPEEYGLYFAWGETQGYSDASSGKEFTWADYKFGTLDNLTKYNNIDNLKTLELEDDAAHVNMGGSWRMPTTNEFIKLYDLCNNEWINDYEGTGVNGRIFKLKTDESKQLFFPATGYCDSGSVYNIGSYGNAWFSSLLSSINYGCLLNFSNTYIDMRGGSSRYYGFSVRGFCDPSLSFEESKTTPKYEIEDTNPDDWKQGEEHDLKIKRTYPVTLDGEILLDITCEGGEITEGEHLTDDGSENWEGNVKVIPSSDKVIVGIASDDIEVEEFEQEEIPEDPFNGHEYIDMGTAGIWATCNIGASSPEETGLYFAWGETEGYPDGNEDKKFTWDDYKFGMLDSLIKYDKIDNISVLELEDDAAHINIGGNWRMPTKDEFQKLYDLCNNEWTDDYEGTGIKGIIFKLKTDEYKQLFFPAGGYCASGSIKYVGSRGYYWSSCIYPSSTPNGYPLFFNSANIYPQNTCIRCTGLNVRAIYDPFNGYDYVDMGEAGYWATCNVGASSPEEYGLYFAWGETKGYPNASGDKKFNWDDYKFGTSSNLTKYNSLDNLITLELEDDAAHVNMGGNWRMPTKDEFVKLYYLCNNEWTTNYEGTGVKGRIFKLKTDESKQLFFPAAGRYNLGLPDNVGSNGYIWYSSISINPIYCYGLYFYSKGSAPETTLDRYAGNSIRGFIPPIS